MIFFVPIYFGPSHIRLYLEIIWSRIKLFNDIATVIMSFQLFYAQSSLIKSYASGPFKIFMITKRDNYMGRHLILALFEEGPILHLNFLAWGPLFLTLSFFLLRARRASLASQGERAPVHVIVEVDLLHISKTVHFRHMLYRRTNVCFDPLNPIEP